MTLHTTYSTLDYTENTNLNPNKKQPVELNMSLRTTEENYSIVRFAMLYDAVVAAVLKIFG